MNDKKKLLINGNGQCKFYLGLDPNTDELIIGIDHPQSDAVIFISGPMIANMSGWLARKQPTLKPLEIN